MNADRRKRRIWEKTYGKPDQLIINIKHAWNNGKLGAKENDTQGKR